MTERDYTESSYREKLVEHIFIVEVLQEMWARQKQVVEVLRSEVDASGYDLVLECGDIVRHVQLKSSRAGSKTSRQNVNIALVRKPAGCVIWIIIDEDRQGRFHLSYRFFGGGPREALPSLEGFGMAKHTKADATGKKAFRPALRVVNKGQFRPAKTTGELVDLLFKCQQPS